ncbi:MAG: hypothetical protein IGS39_25795 [Calothrix sp. C42_A2020_038]|nr:hypothetical protein [Calothrix sp. C42_A2020_038]
MMEIASVIFLIVGLLLGYLFSGSKGSLIQINIYVSFKCSDNFSNNGNNSENFSKNGNNNGNNNGNDNLSRNKGNIDNPMSNDENGNYDLISNTDDN